MQGAAWTKNRSILSSSGGWTRSMGERRYGSGGVAARFRGRDPVGEDVEPCYRTRNGARVGDVFQGAI